MGKYMYYKAESLMKGPFKIISENVNKKELKENDGVYLLAEQSPSSYLVKYVGRGNLNERISRVLNNPDYIHFFYVVRNNAKSMFTKECKAFHRYGKVPRLDNKRHPPRPEGRQDLPHCTEIGCNG